jgi:gas vesicle protein
MEAPNGKLLAALLGGAAVGAALAVLFAPAKGSELRNKIVEEAGGLKDVITKVIKELHGLQAGVNDWTQKQNS